MTIGSPWAVALIVIRSLLYSGLLVQAVSIRMRAMPLPGGGDDVAQRGKAWLPAEFALEGITAGDQDRRVACAARADFGSDVAAGHGAGGGGGGFTRKA